jgi:hypothetical protein
MHKFAFFASLAANAVASPSALTDPAQVAADWHKTFEAARQPILSPGPLGLTASGPGTLAFRPEPPTSAPVFRMRSAPRAGTDSPPPAEADNREVMVVPGVLDPKILHEVAGDMDPKILHGRNDKKTPVLKPFKPVDPRLQPSPAETVVPENK